MVVELRHVGGEMKRARPQNGALAAIDAEYALFAAGRAPTRRRRRRSLRASRP